MSYLHLSDRFTQLFDDPIEVKFPQTTVLLLEQKGLYESCRYSLCWRMHPCGAWAPGRAQKIDLKAHQKALFPKICSIPESWKIFAPEGFRPRNRIETTNAFLDSLLPKEARKFAPGDFFLGIDVIFAFLWSVYPTFWQPNWSQVSPDNRITLRAGRALRAMWTFVALANAPL